MNRIWLLKTSNGACFLFDNRAAVEGTMANTYSNQRMMPERITHIPGFIRWADGTTAEQLPVLSQADHL